jgi:hypothetical protein
MAQRYRYQPAAAADIEPKELEVAGIGLVVEQTPAYALWTQVEEAAGRRLEFPPPAGSLQSCKDKAGLFRAVVLGGALRYWSPDGVRQQTFVESCALPAHIAVPPRAEPFGVWAGSFVRRLRVALSSGAGLPFHDIDPGLSVFRDRVANDTFWSSAFKRFDAAADLHSLLLFAEDGYATRSETGDWPSAQSAGRKEPLDLILSRDKAHGDLSEVFASLLLLRPVAAEWLQEWSMHYLDRSKTTTHANGKTSRDAHGFGQFRTYADDFANGRGYRALGRFTPTPHAPHPWSHVQRAQYDSMPRLAGVCRPRSAHYLDAGNTLLPTTERTGMLQTALQGAIKDHLGGRTPTRIFYDAGTDTAAFARLAVFHQALTAAVPEFQVHDPKAAYDLTQRLGDLGAASAFAGVALAGLAAWETGGTALMVNLRREEGATVLAIRPSNEKYRKQFGKRPYEAA